MEDMSEAPGRDRRPLIAGLATALVVVVFFGWFVTFGPGRWRGSEPSALEAAASQVTPSLTQTPTAVASVLAPQVTTPAPITLTGAAKSLPPTEADALAALAAESEADIKSVRLQGQWVAQLASKYVGIVDPQQVTQSGTHKFFALDIYAEHAVLQAAITDARVLLLDSRSYGTPRTFEGRPYWVTIATSPSFTNADSILSWCASNFPGLSASALNNRCLPTQISPLVG